MELMPYGDACTFWEDNPCFGLQNSTSTRRKLSWIPCCALNESDGYRFQHLNCIPEIAKKNEFCIEPSLHQSVEENQAGLSTVHVVVLLKSSNCWSIEHCNDDVVSCCGYYYSRV
jgi:hypothetical protein